MRHHFIHVHAHRDEIHSGAALTQLPQRIHWYGNTWHFSFKENFINQSIQLSRKIMNQLIKPTTMKERSRTEESSTAVFIYFLFI